MPWQNQGGGGGPWGGGGAGGPWGGGGRGPGGQGQPPNLEEILRKGQEQFRRMLPGGMGGMGGGAAIALIVAVVIGLWALTGFYRVLPDEQGVVLRFGEWTRTTQPGLNYRLPWPVESVQTPKVTRVNRVEVGFRSAGDSPTPRVEAARQLPEEALMLTGDENIIDINFNVLWVINDAGAFLFNVRAPEATIMGAAESTMREIIGQTPIAPALAEGRGQIEQAARERLQQILNDYGAGVEVTQVQLLKVDPPGQVVDAFRDVQRARADQERLRNEAEAYRNDIIPRARGEAERLEQEAEAYRQEVVARAQGDGDRFINVHNAFQASREVTTQRIYLETMQAVLGNTNKVIIDQDREAGNGVVPYLPLTEVHRRLDRQQQRVEPQPVGGQQR